MGLALHSTATSQPPVSSSAGGMADASGARNSPCCTARSCAADGCAATLVQSSPAAPPARQQAVGTTRQVPTALPQLLSVAYSAVVLEPGAQNCAPYSRTLMPGLGTASCRPYVDPSSMMVITSVELAVLHAIAWETGRRAVMGASAPG